MRSALLKRAEQAVVLGMVAGTFGMLQPWNIDFYQYGFALLGLCTLAFIVISHVPVQAQ